MARTKRQEVDRLLHEGNVLEFPRVRGQSACAIAHVEDEQRRAAIRLYDEAIALDPTVGEAWLARASAWRRLGEDKKFRADSKKAIAFGFKYPIDYLRASFGYRGASERRLLATGARLAKPGSGDHFMLCVHTVHSYWYERRYDLMLRGARRVQVIHPNFMRGRNGAYLVTLEGDALAALGRFADAEKAYWRGLSPTWMPDITATLLVMMRVYRGDLDGARMVARKVGKYWDKLKCALMDAYLDALGDGPIRCPAWLRRKLHLLAAKNTVGYFGGVVLCRLAERALVEKELRETVTRWRGNALEWGVTFRWEIAQLERLLGLDGGAAAPMAQSSKPKMRKPRRMKPKIRR